MGKDLKRVLRWVMQTQRYHTEAQSRFGHHYDAAVDAGLVCIGGTEVFYADRYRDIRQPIHLTPAGRAALELGDERD